MTDFNQYRTGLHSPLLTDTGAYFVGKNLGRTKLTDISPKKTVEGALGGMASAVAVALALQWLFAWPGSALAAAGYGVLMFISSIFGDLIESIMKREAGIKVCVRFASLKLHLAPLQPAAMCARLAQPPSYFLPTRPGPHCFHTVKLPELCPL